VQISTRLKCYRSHFKSPTNVREILGYTNNVCARFSNTKKHSTVSLRKILGESFGSRAFISGNVFFFFTLLMFGKFLERNVCDANAILGID